MLVCAAQRNHSRATWDEKFTKRSEDVKAGPATCVQLR